MSGPEPQAMEVMEGAAEDPLATALREELGEAVESARTLGGDLTLQVRREAIAEVCATLKENHGFTYLVDLCGVDFPGREPRFEVVYHVCSPAANRRVRLKVAAGEGEAAAVPSVTGVWRGANWPEREVWDLYGVRFDGHPDLARILLWEGFNGHPLRKDFPVEGIDTGAARDGSGRGEVSDPLLPRGEEIELGFGPRHPAIRGVLRLSLRVDGDRIVDCRPVIGHVHRGVEKLFELQPHADNLAHTDRLDFGSAAAANLAYAGAVEKLLGGVVPPRARYLRTILAELQRIASHLLWLGTHAADLGAMPPFFAALGERDGVLQLCERYLEDYFEPDVESDGARLRLDGIRPGGLSHDPPAGWVERCRGFVESFPARLDGCAGPLTENRLWKKRTVGLGVLSPEAAVDLGVTGPALRASGIAWDLRKALPYEAYGEVDFDVPVGRNGDTYDRYLVRVEEMRQANRIVAQCLDRLPDGPVLAEPPALEAKVEGETYHGIEGPRGEIGFYLVGDGMANPYRCHLRAPSFAHLQALPELCRGELVGDLVALIGTLDVALEEADR